MLAAQVDRLLDDPRVERFVDAFLDYWLDLRNIGATAPDMALYPDYYLDDLLSESALLETRAYFMELLRKNLPAHMLVSSDFVMANSRLAAHYNLPPVEGIAIRRVQLPPDSVRGGLLTQASVLKVTANGTTTSPVLRGAWIMERILGQKPRPPPPGIPAVEPDIRGATTIREQLDRHRSVKSCNVCHSQIDPPGLALESLDVLGGWRDHYRAIGDDAPPEFGLGKNGQRFAFHRAAVVNPAGQLADGREFADIRSFKQLLLADEAQLARNFVRHLTVYATGAPVSFGDRETVERILEQTRSANHGLRSLVHALVASELFLCK